MEAYSIYKKEVNNLTLDGRQMIDFNDLPIHIIKAWKRVEELLLEKGFNSGLGNVQDPYPYIELPRGSSLKRFDPSTYVHMDELTDEQKELIKVSKNKIFKAPL